MVTVVRSQICFSLWLDRVLWSCSYKEESRFHQLLVTPRDFKQICFALKCCRPQELAPPGTSKLCLVSLHSETCSSNLKTSMASFSSPLSSQANYVQAYGTRHTQQCQMLHVHKLQTCRKGSHWLKHCGCSVQVCDWQKTSKFPRRNTTESSHAPSASVCTSFWNTRDLL